MNFPGIVRIVKVSQVSQAGIGLPVDRNKRDVEGSFSRLDGLLSAGILTRHILGQIVFPVVIQIAGGVKEGLNIKRR